jgi:hypothetical protein
MSRNTSFASIANDPVINQSVVLSLYNTSAVLSLNQSAELLGMLPPSLGVSGLEVLYNTSTHGWSLDALYNSTIMAKECILLIKTYDPQLANSEEVLGGYLSCEYLDL